MRGTGGDGWWRGAVAATLLALAVLPLAACRSSGGPRGLLATVDEPRMSETQLRSRLYDFVVQFSGAVTDTADAIAAQADTEEVRHKALLFKVNAVPACQAAAFDADPVVGLIDTWVLVVQLNDFFQSEHAAQALGDLAEIPRAAMAQLEVEIEAITAEISGEDGAPRGREFVHDFARRHPIDRLAFTRASAAPALKRVTAQTRRGVFESVEGLEERVDDISDRLTVYLALAPAQARWQAELLAEQFLDHPELASLKRLPDELPGMLAHEREAALAAVRTEREIVLADIQKQRLDTLAFVTAEREALLAGVTAERVASLEFVRNERDAMLDALTREREVLLAAIEKERTTVLADLERQRLETVEELREERRLVLEWAEQQKAGLVDDVETRAGRTVDAALDRVFLYLLLLGAAPCVLLVIVMVLGRGRIAVDLKSRD
jgi:hypothetical protein